MTKSDAQLYSVTGYYAFTLALEVAADNLLKHWILLGFLRSLHSQSGNAHLAVRVGLLCLRLRLTFAVENIDRLSV